MSSMTLWTCARPPITPQTISPAQSTAVLDDAERGRVGTLCKLFPFEARKIGAMMVVQYCRHLENNWPEIRSRAGGIGVDAQCPHHGRPRARRVSSKKNFNRNRK